MIKNDPPPRPKTKKPYRPPVVRVYGKIAQITRAVGKTGNSDGGSGNTKKTRP
jgi:hypothetical protein